MPSIHHSTPPASNQKPSLPSSQTTASDPFSSGHVSKRRARANDSPQSLDFEDSPAKRSRHSVATPPRWPSDDSCRGRLQSTAHSPYLDSRQWSASPSQGSLLEAPATMLSRAEGTGDTQVVDLARGTPRSPIPPRSSPQPLSRNASETNALSSRSRAESNTSRSRAESTPDDSGTNLFHSTALAELLQQDDRPVFVVDADDERHGNPERLRLIFANDALKRRHSLLDQIQGRAVDQSLLTEVSTPFIDFRAWVLPSLDEVETIDTFSFAGLLWKSASLRKRLKVVTGQTSPLPPPPLLIADPQSSTPFPNAVPLPMLPASAATTSYFERHPPMTSGALHSIFDEGASPQSPMSNPAPSGGLGYSELLTTPVSPVKEQTLKTRTQQTYPVRTLSEGVEGADRKIVSDKGFFDWTRLPDLPNLPPHIQFTRSVDWAATSLGPISGWESDLRGMCNLIMASPHPAAMYWGPEHVAIYNEPYILLAGQKHPALMGSRYRDAWAEIWPALKGVFDNAYHRAQATMKDDDFLCIMRNGFLEECYFSWSIIPLIGDDGSVVGLYNPAFEKTRRKIAERRMLTLKEVGERTATARHVSQFWGLLIDGLSYNELDVPLAMVYSLGKDPSDSEAPLSGSSSGAVSKVARLKATLGITIGHPAAPAFVDLETSTEGFASTFRQALTQDKPIVLRGDDGTLDTSLLHGIQWRGFGDPSRLIVVMPIHPTTGGSTLGFLVIGTNPRRPYDEDFELFVQLLARQLATSIASVVLFEEEIRKGERAAQLAAQDRMELSNQLVARTLEAVEAENKFTRMAELAPVGVFIGDASGQITFVNDAWFRLSSYPRGGPAHKPVDDDWLDYVLEEDQVKASTAWATMFANKVPVSIEFRFKTPWKDKMGNTGVTWVIASAYPEKDEDGNIQRIFGSVTDISDQKFAEILQTKRMEEAVELKRQQERYIDTTSHEMRNPLSAILQSADSITSSLTEMIDGNDLTAAQIDLLDVTIETAQVINLCAQHQKRIVDDVLTLSKLDSAMMIVTPVDAQPVTVVERALKMFESEFQNADIALEFKLDESYTTLNIDWVRLDPHRLSQVLINLTTNAIKFTTSQKRRTIQIYVGASKEKPSTGNKWGLTFIASQNRKDRDVTAAPEWGLGETVYIYFAVQDTGCGLDDLEKKQLFQRFSQANPRTHIHYGGSGLGLFISRELVELQGGEIGVASEAGKGSTFSFYVKARRSSGLLATNEESNFGGLQSRKGSKNRKQLKIKSQVFAGIPSAASSPSDSPKSLPVSWKPASSQTPLHVLIVEDNLINQKVLATSLRKTGCTVYVANHGGEAIEIIRASDFYAHSPSPSHELSQHQHAPAPPISTAIDIVLMDLEMPVMDGVTCARKLRTMQDTGELVRHVPVIAVTANAREEQIQKTLKSGIDDVVSKPFRVGELLPKMREVLARFDMAGQQQRNLERSDTL